jgi:protein tyrosine/serine phosphatase
MTRAESMKKFWKDLNPRLLSAVFLFLLLTSCATIKHVLYTYDPLNLHTVKEGVLYRSAQPTGRDLRMVAEEYRIRSIINLRGASLDKDWYNEEVAVSQELGLERVDIKMSAARLPHREDLLRLFDAFKNLPRPILIHCKAGADRTGEAVTLFAMEQLKWSKRKAAGQLHPYFGHIPDWFPAKTYFVREVYQGEEWAREAYYPCQQNYKYYDKAKYCRVGITFKPYSPEIDDER